MTAQPEDTEPKILKDELTDKEMDKVTGGGTNTTTKGTNTTTKGTSDGPDEKITFVYGA